MKLVGVTGKAGAGKDTTYQILTAISEVPVYRYALADSLKDEVYEHILRPNNIPREHLDDVERKKDYRILLQWWGTEFRRKLFDDAYWLQRLAEKIATHKDEDCIVVVTDIRFPNEADFIKSLGGIIAKVHRPTLTTDGAASQHSSEILLESINADFTIENTGGMDSFILQVRDGLYNDFLKVNTFCFGIADGVVTYP
jgi:hypothetical protein